MFITHALLFKSEIPLLFSKYNSYIVMFSNSIFTSNMKILEETFTHSRTLSNTSLLVKNIQNTQRKDMNYHFTKNVRYRS